MNTNIKSIRWVIFKQDYKFALNDTNDSRFNVLKFHPFPSLVYDCNSIKGPQCRLIKTNQEDFRSIEDQFAVLFSLRYIILHLHKWRNNLNHQEKKLKSILVLYFGLIINQHVYPTVNSNLTVMQTPPLQKQEYLQVPVWPF